MGRIYSQSYFHYTQNLSSLVSILQGGFLGHYCREEFRYNKQIINIYIPMVSFCDIPLAHIPFITYGGFGIGMSSVWGNAQKLTPICYFPKDDGCPLTAFISKQANDYSTRLQKQRKTSGIVPAILAYAKPRYKYTTSGHRADNYIEKEWRKAYLDCSVDLSMHGQPCEKMHLKFTYDQIDFIIVPDNVQRQLLIDFISDFSRIGGNSLSSSQVLSVISKIITIEEIKKNY